MKKIIITVFVTLCFVGVLISLYSFAQNTTKSKNSQYHDDTKQFIHAAPSETLKNMVEDKAPGIYYFGFPTCPWCIELMPTFNSVLLKNNKQAYVTNVRAKDYSNADNILLEKFSIEYTNENRVTFPFIVVIDKNKQVYTHTGTVKGHDASTQKMSQGQKKQLNNDLSKLISKLD